MAAIMAQASMSFSHAGEVLIDPTRATVFELGWQSWSPAGSYAALATSARPRRQIWQVMSFRPEVAAPAEGFQSEGVISIDPGNGDPMTLFAGIDITKSVPTIRAVLQGDRLIVSSTEQISMFQWPTAAAHDEAIAIWADMVAAEFMVGSIPELAPGWCSWYYYWNQITDRDIIRASEGLATREIPAAVIQIDDGWQVAIGDWTPSKRFGDFDRMVQILLQEGRRVGIWLAPFIVGHDSELGRRRSDWCVPNLSAGFNWGGEIGVLDIAQPRVIKYLAETVERLRSKGVDYFKLDYLYAGALIPQGRSHQETVANYRSALSAIREAAGPDATIVGCGAPLIPSIGLVDAMRISPDTSPGWEPPLGDLGQPGGRAAALGIRARRALHGRFWINDPDCLIVRPEVERRAELAATIAASGGLVCSSDPPDRLDSWGLETTRRLMVPSSRRPIVATPPLL